MTMSYWSGHLYYQDNLQRCPDRRHTTGTHVYLQLHRHGHWWRRQTDEDWGICTERSDQLSLVPVNQHALHNKVGVAFNANFRPSNNNKNCAAY